MEFLGAPRPGEWRWFHDEPEQSFDAFVTAAPRVPEGAPLVLVPMGDLDPASLEPLVAPPGVAARAAPVVEVPPTFAERRAAGLPAPVTGLVPRLGVAVPLVAVVPAAPLVLVVAREAARCMRERGAGSIVNIASVSGIRGNAGRVAYGASKAGVIAMTQVMAVELAPVGIRVNAIAPGPVETPMVRSMHTEQARAAWMNAVSSRWCSSRGAVNSRFSAATLSRARSSSLRHAAALLPTSSAISPCPNSNTS